MLFITKVLDNGYIVVKDTLDGVEESVSRCDLQKLDASNIKVYGYSANGRIRTFQDEDSVLKFYTAQSKVQGYSFRLEVVDSGLALTEGSIDTKVFRVPPYVTELGIDFGVDPAYYGIKGIILRCSELVGSRFLKSMSDYACSFSENLISVYLPNVTHISERAFDGCTKLESVTLCDKLDRLGVRVFNRCYSLKSIDLPEAIRCINDACFDHCSSLHSLTFPSSLRALGSKVLKNTSLDLLDMSKCTDLTYISSCALSDCDIKTIILPPNLRMVDRTAFWGCEVEEIRCFKEEWGIPRTLFPKRAKMVDV